MSNIISMSNIAEYKRIKDNLVRCTASKNMIKKYEQRTKDLTNKRAKALEKLIKFFLNTKVVKHTLMQYMDIQKRI